MAIIFLLTCARLHAIVVAPRGEWSSGGEQKKGLNMSEKVNFHGCVSVCRFQALENGPWEIGIQVMLTNGLGNERIMRLSDGAVFDMVHDLREMPATGTMMVVTSGC
jgi:hypothetical protein